MCLSASGLDTVDTVSIDQLIVWHSHRVANESRDPLNRVIPRYREAEATR
jgi:hypothetical protein